MSERKSELFIEAPAKINLFLEVTGRREDGYHEIDTVMQTVRYTDKINISFDPEGEGIALTCNRYYIPTDRGNIAYRCAEEFLRATGKTGRVEMHIEKRIPVAAGLGGGSADGAAVLKALNRLTGAGLSREELAAFSASIGADIPFCVRGGCARATGIGEVFSHASPLVGAELVIAIGGRGSSTPEAYRLLDESGYSGGRNADSMLEALASGDRARVYAEMYNAFEDVIIGQNREIGYLKEKILLGGADAALMSGSGAAVFGVFESKKNARAVCRTLRESGCFAIVAQPT